MSGTGDTDTHDHYHLNGTLPADIPESLKQFLPEDEEGLSYEELVLHQACVYQSYQENMTDRAGGTADDDDDDHSSDSISSEDEDESSSVISQEAMDEAYARSLQEGQEFDEFFIREFNSSSNLNQDDIDPDDMRYEELINLTDEVGVENVGLSAAQLSQLPIFIYTSGMFSDNKEEK
ncbi:hypothetical protein E3N88_03557 [Mikania micrantha]|uniref:Uncharacterized protein n=1 Tax=Mikania micrantha TaxID=192012 RepID=A0A5N6Q968_9ASTR|nr:hypothetical protein E3N88_03557 [Mikania micrantha]